MDAWTPTTLRKSIRLIAGNDLSCKQLQAYIEESPERDNLILQVAFVLRQPETLEKTTWKNLQSTFMFRYYLELPALYGFKPEWLTYGEKPIVVNADELLWALAEQRKKGNIIVNNENQYINCIFNTFEFGVTKRYLFMKIKE